MDHKEQPVPSTKRNEVEHTQSKNLSDPPTNTNTNVTTKIKVDSVSLLDIWKTTQRDPLFPLLQDVVYWRDPLRSTLLFAIGNLFFFLITIGQYSILTLASSIFLVVLGTAYINSLYHNFRGQPNPLEETFENVDLVFPREQIAAHIETIFRVKETVRILLRDSLYCHDLKLTLQAIGVALVLRFIGNVFSDVFLLYLFFIGGFVWPRVYEEKKEQIDALVTYVSTKVYEKLKPHLDKLPKLKLD